MRPSPFSNSQIHWCQSSKSYCWQDNVSRFVFLREDENGSVSIQIAVMNSESEALEELQRTLSIISVSHQTILEEVEGLDPACSPVIYGFGDYKRLQFNVGEIAVAVYGMMSITDLCKVGKLLQMDLKNDSKSWTVAVDSAFPPAVFTDSRELPDSPQLPLLNLENIKLATVENTDLRVADRRSAMRDLKKMGSKKVGGVAATIAKDPEQDWLLRAEALQALGQAEPESAIVAAHAIVNEIPTRAKLEAIGRSELDIQSLSYVRLVALRAIVRYSERNSATTLLQQTILPQLSSEDESIKNEIPQHIDALEAKR